MKYENMKIGYRLMKYYIDRTKCVYDENELALTTARKKAGLAMVNIKKFGGISQY